MNDRFSLRVHPAGFIVLLAAVLFLPSHDVLSAILALLWHEGGHWAAMKVCGVKECKIELTPFGGMADARAFEQMSPLRQIISAAAGVAASAAGLAGCFLMPLNNPFVHSLLNANLSLALINILPLWPLDGARVLLSVARMLGIERVIQKLLTFAAYTAGFSVTALGLYGLWLGHMNWSLLLGGPYLCYAAKAADLSQRVRAIHTLSAKLYNSRCLPISGMACFDSQLQSNAFELISRNETGRYHILLGIDPNTGTVSSIHTETQILKQMFADS